jgi:hypothetical protein
VISVRSDDGGAGAKNSDIILDGLIRRFVPADSVLTVVADTTALDVTEPVPVNAGDTVQIPISEGGIGDFTQLSGWPESHPFREVCSTLTSAEHKAGRVGLRIPVKRALTAVVWYAGTQSWFAMQLIAFIGRCMEWAGEPLWGSTDALLDSPGMPPSRRQDPELVEAAAADPDLAATAGGHGGKAVKLGSRGARTAYVSVRAGQKMMILKYLFRCRDLCVRVRALSVACDQSRVSDEDTALYACMDVDSGLTFHLPPQVRRCVFFHGDFASYP